MSPNRRLRTLASPGGSLYRGPSRPQAVAIALGVALLAIGLSFLYVWQTTQIRDLTARCNSVRGDLVKAEEVNRTLQFQIERAFSLERISRIARTQLGMVEPSVIRYVPLYQSGGE